MKRYVGFVRVSSREQEREGFSLDVQEDGLKAFAQRHGGVIVKLFRIAESASKREERKVFKELVAFVKEHADQLDGILFYKVDRAARNLFDYVELERLEVDFGVPFISVSQPTENTPSGRMQRRVLASMASFYTEQQSVDVREGLKRRVESGLFVGAAPYGYLNVRKDGRSLVEIDPADGPKVTRIFELHGYFGHSLESLSDQLFSEGMVYLPSKPKFYPSVLYYILTNRSYIGEVRYKGQWFPGTHEPLTDRLTWERVQAILGESAYRKHDLTFGGELIECGHCGCPITGEQKFKQTKAGEKAYVYYRCTKYNKPGHPRIRLREEELDEQVLALFDQLRIDDDVYRHWVQTALRQYTESERKTSRDRLSQIKRQHTQVVEEQDRLLTLRLHDEITAETFAAKSTELRDRAASLRLQIESADRGRDELAEVVAKAFELSQSLRAKWVGANPAAKRTILEIVCLNLKLDDVTLVPTIRKPLDVFAKGSEMKQSRGDRI
jgi:site-specific DNA recombinase